MKIKFITDGTSEGTRIINKETGEHIEGVTSAKYEIAERGKGKLYLEIYCTDVDIECDHGELKFTHIMSMKSIDK